jgi:hypothetical protein
MKFLTENQIFKIKESAVATYIEKIKKDKAEVSKIIEERGYFPFAFDLQDPNIKIFSIKRVAHNEESEKTVIGYYLLKDIENFEKSGEKVIKEWSLLISRKQHNDLVKAWAEETKVFSSSSNNEKIIK